jgi:hypothetical protein
MKQLMTKQCEVKKKLLRASAETVIDMDDSSKASVPLNNVETALDDSDPECSESSASASEGRSRTALKIATGLAVATGAGLLALSRYVFADWRSGHGVSRPTLRDEFNERGKQPPAVSIVGKLPN